MHVIQYRWYKNKTQLYRQYDYVQTVQHTRFLGNDCLWWSAALHGQPRSSIRNIRNVFVSVCVNVNYSNNTFEQVLQICNKYASKKQTRHTSGLTKRISLTLCQPLGYLLHPPSNKKATTHKLCVMKIVVIDLWISKYKDLALKKVHYATDSNASHWCISVDTSSSSWNHL